MPWIMRKAMPALGGLAMLGLAACVVAPPPGPAVAGYPPVPPLREEVRLPPPPRPERFVWQPGHWRWDGREFAWIEGRWIERHAVTMRWEPGHWVPRGGRWDWAPAGWY